jgi:hypothetical protein
LRDARKDDNDFIGSAFAYLISTRGAKKILSHAEKYKIQNGIDYFFMKKVPDLWVQVTSPCVVHSPWALSAGDDSDIQFDRTCYTPEDIIENKFEFHQGLDINGNDAAFVGRVPVEDMMAMALDDDRIVGFNTLGFVKKALGPLEPSHYFQPNDGIFLKKKIDKTSGL